MWTTVGNICSKIGSGSTPRGSNYSANGIPFFRSQNVYNNKLVYDDIKYISEEVHQKMKGTEVLANDLLLNITGGSLGRCAVVPVDFNCGNVSQHVCIMRSVLVEPEYFHALVLSSYFAKSMKITGSGREGLPKYNLEQMGFPLPPLTEQQRIVTEIEHWFALLDQIEQEKSDLQTIIKQTKSKILDLAIHGKLVPQDPNDEPAIELLRRINPSFKPCDNAHYKCFPNNWVECTVNDVFDVNPKISAEDDMEAAFISMANIEDSFSNKYSYILRKWSDIKKGYTHFQDNDIAVAKISPCLENRKSAVFTKLPNSVGGGTTELNIFRSEIVAPLYGLYFFKSDYFISNCTNSFNGVVGQQRVATSVIKDMIFCLPPYAEQKRIVAKIEELFVTIDKIKESLEA